MNHYFVVCDQERAYVERLTAAINEEGLVPYQIEGMTDVAEVKAFCTGRQIELLLIEEELVDAQVQSLPVRSLVRLGSVPGVQKADTVFKYQPFTQLMQQVLAQLQEQQTEGSLPEEADGHTRVIGVYSPVDGSRSMPFALALGQTLAKEQRVLYLNFKPLTGLCELLGQTETADLSDLLYLMQQGRRSVSEWKERCIQSFGNMDYVLPVISPDDLHCVPEETLPQIVYAFTECGQYGTIVLEFGEACRAFTSLLLGCAAIYMPVREDRCASAQIRQYEALMRRRGCMPVLKRTVPVRPPRPKETEIGELFLEQVMWGELGDYVRSLLWGTHL